MSFCNASALIISFSSLFLPTTSFAFLSNLKCLPIFNRSMSLIVGVSMCLNKSLALNENAGSVRRQPPPALGGSSIPNSFAIRSCSFLERPLIIPRSFLFIKPFFSGSVGGSNAADSGLTIFPSKPDSFSIFFNAGAN